MEDIKKLLEKNELYLTCSSDDNDTDTESLSFWQSRISEDYCLLNSSEINSSNSGTSKKRNGENRLPTRRPDPNVYNRNALLARENRRKKKVYLETIEKELQFARNANRTLAKALKRQLKIAQRLEKEKSYLKNLVANKSEILTLVNALNFRRSVGSDNYISDGSSHENYAHQDSGNTTDTGILRSRLNDADEFPIDLDSPSSDFENGTECSLATTYTAWDDICCNKDYSGSNPISSNVTVLENSVIKSFNNDHCYVSSLPLNSILADEEQCKSNDYLDEEYDSCSSLNFTCVTPPLQLFSEHSS